jgi:hypothetical protein
MTGPATNAPQPADDDDLYLLRGLLACELCNTILVPVMLGGLRHYGCQNVPRCPRPLVLAEVTEQRVWNRLASRRYELTKGVKRYQRRAVLTMALHRVGVGLRPSELHYEWREERHHAG